MNDFVVRIAAGSAMLLALVAQAQTPGPEAVYQKFLDARNAGDANGAIAAWADDSIFINSRGIQRVGQDEVAKIIRSSISAHTKNTVLSSQEEGSRVRSIENETTDFYEKLGVAPVEFINDTIVEGGKIKSHVAYIAPKEIVRLNRACGTPDAKDLLMFGLTCAEFVRLARARTETLGLH